MADKKISQLTNLTGANLADADEFPVVDTSADETKAITFGELKSAFDTGTGFVRVTGDTMTGDLTVPNVVVSGNVDGRDVSADGSKLDGIEAGADVTDTTNVTAAGALMTTGGSVTGDVSFGDNDKAIFGAGSDLQIYHDGSNSIIRDAGVGDMRLWVNDFKIYDAAGTTALLTLFDTGATNLGYAGAFKLATTSTGVDITGTLTSDGLTVDGIGSITDNVGGGVASLLTLHNDNPVSGTTAELKLAGGNGPSTRYAYIRAFNGGSSSGNAHALFFGTNSPSAAPLDRLSISSGGDISFYEDTGSTPKFFWDASAESLGIGTTSPAVAGRLNIVQKVNTDVNGLNGIRVDDSASTVYAGFGIVSGTDLRITSGDAGGTADTNIVFRTAASGSEVERMRIDSSGNVGIGTSSPNAELDVNGNIRADQFIPYGDSESAPGLCVAADGDTGFFRPAGNTIGVSTGGSERMRIDSSGNLLVGTTTEPSGGSGGSAFTAETAGRMVLRMSQTITSNSTLVVFSNSNGTVGTINTSGSSTLYNTSSDYRLKTDAQPMTGASDRVLALKPCNFAWKADGTRVDGFLAHEAQEVVPEAVTGTKDGEEMQAIDQSKLVPLLTAALQEALTKIDALETRITALEG